MEYDIYKVSLSDETFHEQNFYLQSILPFFIDGASVIEPSPFWKYFLIYQRNTQHLVAYCTVFEAHKTAVQFRAKISQIIVPKLYQKRGLGQYLYEKMFSHYRNN